MSFSSKKTSKVKVIINVYPSGERFSYYFDDNKSFGDLKNELIEFQKIEEGEYFTEMNNHVKNDDLILKDNDVKKDSYVNIIRNDCVKINLKVKDWNDRIQILQKYVSLSDFKVIKANENKEINVCCIADDNNKGNNNLLLYYM